VSGLPDGKYSILAVGFPTSRHFHNYSLTNVMLTYVTLLRLTLVMGYIEYIEGYMTGFCFVKTKRNVHSLEMQIGADSSYVVSS